MYESNSYMVLLEPSKTLLVRYIYCGMSIPLHSLETVIERQLA